jgi:hypothetical protein
MATTSHFAVCLPMALLGAVAGFMLLVVILVLPYFDFVGV